MAKYLKLFQNVEDANLQGANGLFAPHVSVVSGKSAVNMLKIESELFTCSFDNDGHIFNPQPKVNIHNVGDIAYFSKGNISFIPYTQWDSELGKPVAVCVIPTSHALTWGNGIARFVSIEAINEQGEAIPSDIVMPWGPEEEISLRNFQKIPIWDNIIGGTKSSENFGQLSSDLFTGVANSIDSASKYSTSLKYGMVPSPYAADGSFYEDYIREIEIGNALSDFNGKYNTMICVNKGNNYTMANACNKYSIDGISSGNWYLPACGEIGYLISRQKLINEAITKCGGTVLGEKASYWSSTERSDVYTYYAGLGKGSISGYKKTEYEHISGRPFTQLN